MSKKLVIIGASGHVKVVADIALRMGYEVIVFLDDNEKVQNCGRYPVVGTSQDIMKYKQFDFIVAIGNTTVRQKIINELLAKGVHVCKLIHPSAIVAEDTSIDIGTVIMAGAVVNTGAKIGKGCIINTCSSVDHDCRIENFVHVAVGAHIAGTVHIGERTWIGAGATIRNNIDVTNDCIIGIGATVVGDIKEKGTYIGVPAKKMKNKLV